MRRVLKSEQRKRADAARARASAKRSLARKEWKRRANEANNKKPKTKGFQRTPTEVSSFYPTYKKVKAPSHFSLVNNPEETIEFLSTLKKQFDSRSKTFVVLKDVATLDDDAIVLLLSIMVRFKSQGVAFNGDYPNHGAARAKLVGSGFIPNLMRKFKDEDRYVISTQDVESIHTHARKNVDAVLSNQIIGKASKFLWSELKRCQGVQRTMIELMLNTNNHAAISPGEKHWWLSLSYDEVARKVKFSFVDYGVGIFTSLSGKKEGSKFFGILQAMKNAFSPKDNGETLRHILNGELHRTATNQDFRGKGLPGIKQAQDRGWISNLHVVTNDVYASVAEDRYYTLKKPFMGTFIHWELTTENLHYDGHSQT